MTNKEKKFWILFWQTNCAGGATTEFMCRKKGTRCDKEDKLLCQDAMKRFMKSLGYGKSNAKKKER